METVSGEDDRQCCGKPLDSCESLELSKVQIGPETYRSYESRERNANRGTVRAGARRDLVAAHRQVLLEHEQSHAQAMAQERAARHRDSLKILVGF